METTESEWQIACRYCPAFCLVSVSVNRNSCGMLANGSAIDADWKAFDVLQEL
jgi:hypothetical protein